MPGELRPGGCRHRDQRVRRRPDPGEDACEDGLGLAEVRGDQDDGADQEQVRAGDEGDDHGREDPVMVREVEQDGARLARDPEHPADRGDHLIPVRDQQREAHHQGDDRAAEDGQDDGERPVVVDELGDGGGRVDDPLPDLLPVHHEDGQPGRHRGDGHHYEQQGPGRRDGGDGRLRHGDRVGPDRDQQDTADGRRQRDADLGVPPQPVGQRHRLVDRGADDRDQGRPDHDQERADGVPRPVHPLVEGGLDAGPASDVVAPLDDRSRHGLDRVVGVLGVLAREHQGGVQGRAVAGGRLQRRRVGLDDLSPGLLVLPDAVGALEQGREPGGLARRLHAQALGRLRVVPHRDRPGRRRRSQLLDLGRQLGEGLLEIQDHEPVRAHARLDRGRDLLESPGQALGAEVGGELACAQPEGGQLLALRCGDRLEVLDGVSQVLGRLVRAHPVDGHRGDRCGDVGEGDVGGRRDREDRVQAPGHGLEGRLALRDGRHQCGGDLGGVGGLEVVVLQGAGDRVSDLRQIGVLRLRALGGGA